MRVFLESFEHRSNWTTHLSVSTAIPGGQNTHYHFWTPKEDSPAPCAQHLPPITQQTAIKENNPNWHRIDNMVGLRHQTAFHYDRDEHGRAITAEEREKLIAPYLPEIDTPDNAVISEKSKTVPRKHFSQQIRHLIKSTLHVILYNLIQFIFSVYVRFRIAYHNVAYKITSIMYHHHRAPEYIQKDVEGLERIPHHLSTILELDQNDKSPASLESLVNDVCEVAAWSACAGIPMLSIYEKTGNSFGPRPTACQTRSS